MDRLVNLAGSNVCVVVPDAASQLLRLPQLLASLPVDDAALVEEANQATDDGSVLAAIQPFSSQSFHPAVTLVLTTISYPAYTATSCQLEQL